MSWYGLAYLAMAAVSSGVAWNQAPWAEWAENDRDIGTLGISCLVIGAAWPFVALMWCGHTIAAYAKARAAVSTSIATESSRTRGTPDHVATRDTRDGIVGEETK